MRSTICLIGVIALLCSGCMFGSGPSDFRNTTEMTFRDIEVQQFEHNRLLFKGTKKNHTETYIYDLSQETLLITQNDHLLTPQQKRTYYLGEYGKLSHVADKDKNRLVLERSAHRDPEDIVNVPQRIDLGVSVSPNQESFLYWTMNDGQSQLYLYDLDQGVSEKVDGFPGKIRSEDIAWSATGDYFLLKSRQVFRSSDGKNVLTIPNGQAYLSPSRDELIALEKAEKKGKSSLEIDRFYGHRIVKYTLGTGEAEPLFSSSSGENITLIFDQLVWDHQGLFFAFVTGDVRDEQIFYEKIHIMDVAGGFHHVENEQNLLPTSVTDLSFNPSSHFFTYTANGLLKVLYIPTQRTKLFDVYAQMQNQNNHYMIYGRDAVWVLESHAIKKLGHDLEEKTVYETKDELLSFYVDSNEHKLMVIERNGEQHEMRLITLNEDHTPESEAD